MQTDEYRLVRIFEGVQMDFPRKPVKTYDGLLIQAKQAAQEINYDYDQLFYLSIDWKNQKIKVGHFTNAELGLD